MQHPGGNAEQPGALKPGLCVCVSRSAGAESCGELRTVIGLLRTSVGVQSLLQATAN